MARFGDIRIAAVPLASDALASAFPFETTSGTWAGDVRINSRANFGAGGVDLTTVLMQEAGHVFGLDNSPDRDSVMYEDYLGRRDGPSATDIAALQTLYGARTPDALEGSQGNDDLLRAYRLNLLANADGSLSMTALADVSTLTDRDVFKFTTPLSAGSLVVGLQTSGLSLLTSRLSVFDSAGRPVAATKAIDPLSGDLTLRLDGVKVLSTYYVAVEGADDTVFGIGSYGLKVSYLPLAHSLVGGLTQAVGGALDTLTQTLANNDLHTNDSIGSAIMVQQSLAATTSPLDYAFRASISDRTDKDFYRVTAPSDPAGALTVMAWGTPSRLRPGEYLTPRVNVYDSLGRRVAVETLVNNGYTHTVQLTNPTRGATYYVEIKAADPQGTHGIGNYFLGVDFTQRPVVLAKAAEGELKGGTDSHTTTISTDMSGVHHFVLTAEGTAGDSVQMKLYDAMGQQVFAMTAMAGDSVSGDVYLERGTYRIVFAGSKDKLRYLLRFTRLSDNNGPEPIDPTQDPSTAPPPPKTAKTSTSSSSPSGVQPQEPTSDPYTAQQDPPPPQPYWGTYSDSPNYDGTSPSGTAKV
jgi:hypothetical protein